MIRAAILTVSDTGFLGMRRDVSGPALAARAAELGWQVTITALLPDEPDQIAAKLIELCGVVNLILVTGGTGIAARDSTPEAARRVLERELTGFGELMRAEGMKKTRLAALSRSLAGTRGKTLIVCVPGSPKGAVESLDAIADLIPHAVQLLAGGDPH
jgi:molybdopterin adenylyltransferase